MTIIYYDPKAVKNNQIAISIVDNPHYKASRYRVEVEPDFSINRLSHTKHVYEFERRGS